jgi:hypothetical protein
MRLLRTYCNAPLQLPLPDTAFCLRPPLALILYNLADVYLPLAENLKRVTHAGDLLLVKALSLPPFFACGT